MRLMIERGKSFTGFRKKIIFSFSILVFIISLFLGIVYYSYSVRNLLDSTKKDMNYVSTQMCNNLSDSIEDMKHASDYLLSSDDTLDAMKNLSFYKKTGMDVEWESAIAAIERSICIDYFNRNFYRVIYFNEVGDILSSTNVSERTVNREKDVSEISWLDEAAARKGKMLVLGPHKDDWRSRENNTLFLSVVRKVQGGDFGYIEVQQTVDSIKEKLLQSVVDMEVMAVLDEEEILFQSETIEDTEELLQCAAGISENATVQSTLDAKRKLISVSRDEKYGVSIILVRDMSFLSNNIRMLLPMVLLMVLLFFLMGVLLVVALAGKVTAPIRQLRKQMEHTSLENLEETVEETALILNSNDDEVVALGEAYQRLMNRLNESMVKEKRLSLLQLQTQFDTLQAQVNPHFIYNVLNVISNRGIVSGDEEICEICGSLAAMLRYSTNTKERYATVGEELEYVRQYACLLKSRYDQHLEVEISSDQEIERELLPKIVIQQLVENSIQHGFNRRYSVMKIRVYGWQDENGWYVEVQDNGDGMTEEALQDFTVKKEHIKNQILMRRSGIEMEIGGMGLANAYARMFLLYANQTVFSIKNQEKGVSITVGVRRKEEKERASSDGC